MQENPATTGEPDDLPETFRVTGEGLNFLGYTFRYDRDWYGREGHYLNLTVSEKSLQRVRDKLREMTDARQCFTPIRDLIERINRMLQGWQGYFSQGYAHQAYRDVDSYTLRRLRNHLNRRSQRGYQKPKDATWWDHLQRLGWIPLQKTRGETVTAERRTIRESRMRENRPSGSTRED